MKRETEKKAMIATKDDPKVKDLGDSTGNLTKNPETHDDEEAKETSTIGKAGQSTKVAKIDGNPDDDASLSPEERKAKAWTINMGKTLLADAEDDDEDTTRKVDFEFVKQMEIDRAQRERRKVERSIKAKVITKAKTSPIVDRMIKEEVEKRLREKTPQIKNDPVSKKLFFNTPDDENVDARLYRERMEKAMEYDESLRRRREGREEQDKFKEHMEKREAEEKRKQDELAKDEDQRKRKQQDENERKSRVKLEKKRQRQEHLERVKLLEQQLDEEKRKDVDDDTDEESEQSVSEVHSEPECDSCSSSVSLSTSFCFSSSSCCSKSLTLSRCSCLCRSFSSFTLNFRSFSSCCFLFR